MLETTKLLTSFLVNPPVLVLGLLLVVASSFCCCCCWGCWCWGWCLGIMIGLRLMVVRIVFCDFLPCLALRLRCDWSIGCCMVVPLSLSLSRESLSRESLSLFL